MGKINMGQWVQNKIEDKDYPEIYWVNKAIGVFEMKWVHASGHKWKEDNAKVFKAWALHTGKYKKGDAPVPKRWKANFRCALNSLPYVEMLDDMRQSRGVNATRRFRMTPYDKRQRRKMNKKEKKIKIEDKDEKIKEEKEEIKERKMLQNGFPYSSRFHLKKEEETSSSIKQEEEYSSASNSPRSPPKDDFLSKTLKESMISLHSTNINFIDTPLNSPSPTTPRLFENQKPVPYFAEMDFLRKQRTTQVKDETPTYTNLTSNLNLPSISNAFINTLDEQKKLRKLESKTEMKPFDCLNDIKQQPFNFNRFYATSGAQAQNVNSKAFNWEIEHHQQQSFDSGYCSSDDLSMTSDSSLPINLIDSILSDGSMSDFGESPNKDDSISTPLSIDQFLPAVWDYTDL